MRRRAPHVARCGRLLLVLVAASPACASAPEAPLVQRVPTHGGADSAHFRIGDQDYLAFASYRDDYGYDTQSPILRWDAPRGVFEPFQTLPTHGAWDVEPFRVGEERFLAFANYRDYFGYVVDSEIFRWDPRLGRFSSFQRVTTMGALGFEHFQIGTTDFLAVANFCDGMTHDIESVIYRWDPVRLRFLPYQSIPTHGAWSISHFRIHRDDFLAIANHRTDDRYRIQSVVYEWDNARGRFEVLQRIDTRGASDVEPFQIGDTHYLAFSNAWDGSSFGTTSSVYRWVPSERSFELAQEIPTQGAFDVEHFQTPAGHYLAFSNSREDRSVEDRVDNDSVVLRWSAATSTFDPVLSFTTRGADDIEHFAIGGRHYLSVSNEFSYAAWSRNTDSVIFRWDDERLGREVVPRWPSGRATQPTGVQGGR